MSSKTRIVLVDDHSLLRNGLTSLLHSYGYEILFEADNGLDLQKKLKRADIIPDIILLDINMPLLNGYDTAAWLKEEFPLVKVIALTMNDDELSVIRMIRNGARGYVMKDGEPDELRTTIDTVMLKGYAFSEMMSSSMLQTLVMDDASEDHATLLSEREKELLYQLCSEKTYKQIADLMNISPKTVESYRESLFQKLKAKSRTGAVLQGLRLKLISLN